MRKRGYGSSPLDPPPRTSGGSTSSGKQWCLQRRRPRRTSATSPTLSAASSIARMRPLELPIYLAMGAKAKGIEVNQLVDELLKSDIDHIETAK